MLAGLGCVGMGQRVMPKERNGSGGAGDGGYPRQGRQGLVPVDCDRYLIHIVRDVYTRFAEPRWIRFRDRRLVLRPHHIEVILVMAAGVSVLNMVALRRSSAVGASYISSSSDGGHPRSS